MVKGSWLMGKGEWLALDHGEYSSVLVKSLKEYKIYVGV